MTALKRVVGLGAAGVEDAGVPGEGTSCWARGVSDVSIVVRAEDWAELTADAAGRAEL